MNPYRLAYPVERYRYLTYGEPICFAAADINLDAHVNAEDYTAFATLEVADDLRVDINGNGVVKIDTGTWEDPSMWAGADTNLFELEYARATCYEHKEIGNAFVGDGDALAIESGYHYTDGGGIPVLSQPDHTFYKDSTIQELPCVGINNRFGYGGYWFEPELGVYFVRHRVLDPKSGRWLTRDPIGYAGGWNLYEYCGGMPYQFIDPMGRDWLDWLVNAGSGIADAVTFGLTNLARDGLGVNDAVNKEVGSYRYSFGVGVVATSVVPGTIAARGTILLTGARGMVAAAGGGAIGLGVADAYVQTRFIDMGYQQQFDAQQNSMMYGFGGLLGVVGEIAYAIAVTENAPTIVSAVAPPRVSLNSREYVGQVDAYGLYGEDVPLKVGLTARGVNSEGTLIRVQEQLDKLYKEFPDIPWTWRQLRTFNNRADALDWERTIVERYRRIYGPDSLPCNPRKPPY